MELKRGYKQTEMGVIPEDWELWPVRRMGDVVTGKALAAHAPGLQRPYLRTKNVFDGWIDVSDVLSMPMTDEQFTHFEVRPGDLLLNEGQSLELVGRCSMYRGEFPGRCAIQNQLLRFRAKPGVSADFACQLFRHCQHTGVFARVALQTTSIAHLGGTRFERLCLAWPPTEDEQCKIGTALSDVDALLDGLDRLIAKKRDLKKAAMQELLSGRTRLPGFKARWQPTSLGLLGRTYPGLTGKTKADFGTGNARYISFLNVMNNVVLSPSGFEPVRVAPAEQQNQARKGDLFFTGSSETPEEVAMCALLTHDRDALYLNSFCFGFRLFDPGAVSGLYLAYYLRSGEGRKLVFQLAQGATRHNVSKTALLALDFPIPEYEEQCAIAEALADFDADLTALEARRRKAQLLKQAMMQELLTGRTRLIDTQGAIA